LKWGAVIVAIVIAVVVLDSSTRQSVLELFYREPCQDNQPLSYWIRELKNPAGQARREAITNIGEIGPAAAAAIPALVDVARHDHISLRSWAISDGLGRVGKPALPALRPFLKDRSVRTVTVCAIGEIGPDASEAVPDMIPLLKDSTWLTRMQTCNALAKIGPGASKAIPALLELKSDTNPNVHQELVKALACIDPDGSIRLALEKNPHKPSSP
jgi:HEAT repeat protein